MTQQVQYTGHGTNTGGLQGHSIGDEYPYTVAKIENGSVKVWVVLDTRDNHQQGFFKQYKDASARIRELKGLV